MRPPPRPSSSRYERPSAASPAASIKSGSTSYGGTKRKEREFERDDGETNINVVVRCRGRNEREVRENSGVVISIDGVKSKFLELSMGPNSLSNKTYHFDKVFSSAADQAIIYDDVVTPILDEMLSGYNCTIFAYGQTGTGKTYTMSGDMNDTYGMLSDSAGIIPRALHALFTKLDINDAEWSVKCSFIELYNEELRDLISPEDNAKLKIYDDNNTKKGHPSTIVQGMEETHIKSAVEGIKLLQAGSLKRQVAATKCNDLSSRSHTVFTVTAYIKRTGENGEDFISAGKLNLVDLAGSENIQRSGAENKRAAEAGLINKSLLTLGRVINALVDKSSHIPYRESKLTRLLQDSLGGRTKTCIIATVSPARSNLEETISTLDYAFRAKNIRNKPQINQMINKKTLLKDFTVEIEKLKSELIATRQRNGVYLSNESYEEMTVESESRRILSEEQAAKIRMMEINLRNKVQELFSLTASFMNLKKDNESIKAVLDETKTVLEQTEFVLAATRQSLSNETLLRKAHQETEDQLSSLGNKLISTLNQTVHDIDNLHAKNSRKSDLQSLNRSIWSLSQARVSEITTVVESRVEDFSDRQQESMAIISSRIRSFVSNELEHSHATQAFFEENIAALRGLEDEALKKTENTKQDIDSVLEEIKLIRDNLKSLVGEGLQELLKIAAERISAEVVSELGCFHNQLHNSYSSLECNVKSIFQDLLKHIHEQKNEVAVIRQQLAAATELQKQSNMAASLKLDDVLRQERDKAAAERQELLSQITSLVLAQGESQESRLAARISDVQKDLTASKETFEISKLNYDQGMDLWCQHEEKLAEEVSRSREILDKKLKEDWAAANQRNARVHDAAESVHAETVRIIDSQILDIEKQMCNIDELVTLAYSQNAKHHNSQSESLQSLSSTIQSSYFKINSHFTSSSERVRNHGDEIINKSNTIQKSLEHLLVSLCHPLTQLRENVSEVQLLEYKPTGETPAKTHYSYPSVLPRTGDHSVLLETTQGPTNLHNPKSTSLSTAPFVFNDESHPPSPQSSFSLQTGSPGSCCGLKELDVNISKVNCQNNETEDQLVTIPSSKKSKTGARKGKGQGKLPTWGGKKNGVLLDGKPLTSAVSTLIASQESVRRRSPRIASS